MKIIYAFIDSQNVTLAIKSLGWSLDFRKFYVYLQKKHHVQKAFLFIGYVPGNEKLYTFLQQAGYILVFKKTLEVKGHIKGNCDAELVLHCMIEYPNYDEAIIISGDGDFYCLIEYLQKRGKLSKVGIPNKKAFSRLLVDFRTPYFFYVSDLSEKLALLKKR